MTKTELAEKILSYDSTARIDITTGCSASNLSITVLQELVAEWQEQNVPQTPKLSKNFCKTCLKPTTAIYCSVDCAQSYGFGKNMGMTVPDAEKTGYQERRLPPVDGCIIREIPEPDPACPPDYNS